MYDVNGIIIILKIHAKKNVAVIVTIHADILHNVENNSREKAVVTNCTAKYALVSNLNRVRERFKQSSQNIIAMRPTKQLQQNLSIGDICLMRYSAGDERKSLLATVVDVDEFSDYHPVKLICKVDAESMSLLETGVQVSLLSKKSDLLLYVLLKGSVFQQLIPEELIILSITDIQFFTREQKNNISSFKKVKNLAVLSAA